MKGSSRSQPWPLGHGLRHGGFDDGACFRRIEVDRFSELRLVAEFHAMDATGLL